MIYRNQHEGETILVLASGPSLNDFNVCDLQRFTTIGINQICRRLDPDYVTLMDTPKFWGEGIAPGLRSLHKCQTLLVKPNEDHWFEWKSKMPKHLQLKVQSTVIELDMVTTWMEWNPDEYQAHVDGWEKWLTTLPHGITSTSLATWMAAFMGAARVGIIGLDMGDHYFFESAKPHATPPDNMETNIKWFGEMANMVHRTTGTEVYNLSKRTLVDSIAKDDLALWLMEMDKEDR